MRLDLEVHLTRVRATRQRLASHQHEHLLDVDEIGTGLAARRFEARQLNERVHDRSHPVGLPTHLIEGPAPCRIETGVLAERVDVARDHCQRRAQFVRGIRDKILAHRLEANLARDIAHQQQLLASAVRDHVQRNVHLGRQRRAHHDRLRELAHGEVAAEVRVAYEVVDALAVVDFATQ